MQYFCRIFLIGNPTDWMNIIVEKDIFYLAISTLLVAAGGYIINDYYDIKIDLINKPEKVIIGKYITRRNSFIIQLILNFLALLIATFALSYKVGIFILACEILLWYYSNRLKRTAILGNISISLLAFCSVYILELYYKKNANIVLFYSIFSFVITYIREVVKDIEDIKGDENYNSKTMPILIGVSNTKIVLYIVSICTIIITFVLPKINMIHYYFLIATTSLPLIVFVILLYFSDKKNNFNIITRLLKLIMVAGIFTMIFVS